MGAVCSYIRICELYMDRGYSCKVCVANYKDVVKLYTIPQLISNLYNSIHLNYIPSIKEESAISFGACDINWHEYISLETRLGRLDHGLRLHAWICICQIPAELCCPCLQADGGVYFYLGILVTFWGTT